MNERCRLDVLLVQRGDFPSRAKAQAAIADGRIELNGKTCLKSGQLINDYAQLTVTKPVNPLVSRGGEKLRHALDYFPIDVSSKICIDVGASTGGFTQALLEAGARRVFALDVGHGQLAESLRSDSRVLNLEGCNFRYFDLSQLPEKPDFACVDVSFISLKLILPKLAECCPREAVCLVKPQFEAGKQALNKHGVVKDSKTRERVLSEITQAARLCGFEAGGVCDSPIPGGSGNKEFLLHLNANWT